ncbi:hypothetical protein LCY76_16500 [Fictibacillus sp. KIGAM418]|uniref:Uncharacterized protein n=1 Tax=Fictibacillus marinisediminis TaxID=2878389 RepID=A0A9X2BI41_9BACL|nr:hypothetical protein [Fictibacillus marinisediminis]MCK6258178.1 hypothetical protein [Fictibacillus marinisediminis]
MGVGEDLVQIILFILLGMIVAYALVLAASNFGLILLGGATFGVLLYIAIHISKKQGK